MPHRRGACFAGDVDEGLVGSAGDNQVDFLRAEPVYEAELESYLLVEFPLRRLVPGDDCSKFFVAHSISEFARRPPVSRHAAD